MIDSYNSWNTKYLTWEFNQKPPPFPLLQSFLMSVFHSKTQGFQGFQIEIIVINFKDSRNRENVKKDFATEIEHQKFQLKYLQNKDSITAGKAKYMYGIAMFSRTDSPTSGFAVPIYTVTKQYQYLWHDRLNASSPSLIANFVMPGQSVSYFEPFADKLASQIYLKPHEDRGGSK